MVIPLLSSAFIHSPELMDELNTALCRHRFSRKLVLFPVLLEELPREPAYLRLLFCLFSCSDSFWTRQKLPSGLKTKITASSAVCLRAAATVITYVICSAESVSGYFKTLFSVDELMTSRMQLGMKEEAKLNFNPLLFTETNTGHMVPRKDSEEDDIATNEVVPRGCHGTTFPLTNGIVEEKNLLLADITKTEVEIAADSDYVSIDSSKLNRPKIDTTTENGVTDSTNVLMMSIFNPGQLAEDYEHYTEQRKADAEGAVSETNNVVASESYSPSEQKTPTERKNKKCVSFEPPSSDGDTAAENETDKNLSPVVTDSDYENDIKNEAKSSNLDQGDSMVLDQDQLNEEKVPQQESENSPDSMGNKTSAERTVTEERDLEERAGAVDIQRAPLRKKMHRSRTCSIC